MLLGIDIGGTSIKAGVFDEEIKLIKKIKVPYGNRINMDSFPFFLIESIVAISLDFINEFDKIHKIGIGVPGVVSKDGIIAVAPNMNGIVDFHILDLLRDRIKLPMVIDNDANVAALAELYEGNGAGLDNFVYVTLGTGIGGAIISDGKIFRGSSGGAGEIGHIIIDLDSDKYDSRSYRKGTIEVFAGRQGILNTAQELLVDYPKSKLNHIDNIDVEDISNWAEFGDQCATEIINLTGYRIGTALVNTANILDIADFIIGGGISKSKILISKIEETMKTRAIPSISKKVKVIPAKYVEDTGIYGAAVFAKYFCN